MVHFYILHDFFLILFLIILVFFIPFFICISFTQKQKNLQQAMNFMDSNNFRFVFHYSFLNSLLVFKFLMPLRKFHLEMNFLNFRFVQRPDSRQLNSTKKKDFSYDQVVHLLAVHLVEVLKNQANQNFKIGHYLIILIISFYVLGHTIILLLMQTDFYLFFVNYYQIERHLPNLVIFLEILYKIHHSNYYQIIHLYQMMKTNLYLFILKLHLISYDHFLSF